MKLLYLINQITNSGGIERIVIDKVNYLVEHGYRVGLVYYGIRGETSFYPIDSRVELMPISRDVSSSSFTTKILSFRDIYSQTKKYITQYQPDVIVNANVRVVSYFLPFVFRTIPKIVELHFSYDGLKIMNHSLYGENYLKIWFQNLLRKTVYPRYDRCIVLTNDDAKSWGFKNIEVIENFSNVKTIDGIREHGFNCAITVGRLEFQKDHESLVRSWALVHQQHPEWILNIWGNGKEKLNLENLIKKYNLQGIINLCGVTNDIQAEYLKSDFFILSSRYEGQPLVMIEAMQCGLPCVSYAITGTRDVIENNKNGYLIEKHKPENLAEGICNMIENMRNWNNMSQCALTTTHRFEKESIMQKWITLFDCLKKISEKKDEENC